MSYRLVNYENPERRIFLNNWAWYAILDLAEKHGWVPRGTVTPERLELAGLHPPNNPGFEGNYWGRGTRLVLIEDALNLADALDEAFIRFEPRRLPSLHPFHLHSRNGNPDGNQPGIGVILLMIRFCGEGAFIIKRI